MRFAAASGKEKWRDRGLATAFVIGLWLILAVFFDFYYDLNDDTAMKDILSGTYTGVPEGHNIQMLYPLGWLISLFYRMAPDIPWYGVFLCGCQFLAAGIGVYGVCAYICTVKKKMAVMCLLTAAAGILFLYEFVFVQYTVTAGLLACAALIRIFTCPDSGEKQFFRYHTLTVLLVGLAFFLRTEMLLLLCPFLGLALIFRAGKEWFPSKDKNDINAVKARMQAVKGYGIMFAFTVILMVSGVAADKAAYSSTEWKQFRQFFEDRTRVYDFYGLPSYEEHREFYVSIGLSEAEYTLLDNYNFDLDDAIDADMMHKIAEYAASHQGITVAGKLYESIYAYVYRFTHGEELIFDLFLVFSYFFLIRMALAAKNPALMGKIILLFGVRTVLWLFLLYRGRLVERVTHPLYLIELIMLGLYFLSVMDVLRWKKFEKSAILSLYVVLLVCTAFSHIQTVREQYRKREEINMQWQTWKEYCRERPKQFYYLDVYSSVPYSEKMFSDTESSYRNFDLPGGWCVKSPIAGEKRERAGFESAEAGILAGKALFAADHTKEERNPDFLIPYYRQKGKEIIVKETDRCGNFSVYQVVGAK